MDYDRTLIRSTLEGFKYMLVGYAFKSQNKQVIQMTIFGQINKEIYWVVCLSTINKRARKKNSIMLKSTLGRIVDSSVVAPYAHSGIEGLSYEEMKETVTDTGWNITWK